MLSPCHICMHYIISTLWSLAQSVNTAVGPCLCVYGTLFFLHVYISSFYSLTQSFNTGRSLWSLPVFLWCFDFLTFVCILLFLHSNHWLNLLTQAGAFSPCLCMYVTLFFLYLYPSFYFYPCLCACSHTLSPLCPLTPLLAQCSTYLPHSPLYSHASPPHSLSQL